MLLDYLLTFGQVRRWEMAKVEEAFSKYVKFVSN